MAQKTRQQHELGDFQTPIALARDVCARLVAHGVRPASVLEPTCGRGAFLGAALEAFPAARSFLGLELREEHLDEAARLLGDALGRGRLSLRREDLFRVDWPAVLQGLPSPVLVLGNPPWVTNAALGVLGSGNLPPKVNAEGLRGLEARTGRSNFDISEWLLLRLLEGLAPLPGSALAMLVKTSVARRVLAQGCRRGLPFGEAHLHGVDALAHFGASVDAALLLLWRRGEAATFQCARWPTLGAERPEGHLAWAGGVLVADRDAFEAARGLRATEPQGWRSGVKHDCAKVLELRPLGEGLRGGLRNGLGEAVDVEEEVIFPLLKSSDLAHGRTAIRRWLLVPQRRLGESPAALRDAAPRAWAYLEGHRDRLDRRRSSIYRGRPPFSLFGIGDYSFSPWKVAISGLYGTPRFVAVGPEEGRPVLFDDTVCFRPCAGEQEARALAALLNGPRAGRYFQAFLFADAKRPVTIALLDGLDLGLLAAWDVAAGSPEAPG